MEHTKTGSNEGRLDALDYLRGLAALGIMIYHLTSWIFGSLPSDSFLGRVGTYGVSIFYVLSGITLHHVYFAQMESLRDVGQFFIRRVFRIFPLLWLVTAVAIMLASTRPDSITIFLNLTGLFGFVAWDAYISTGVWSIGNELVFYALFPILVFSAKRKGFLWVTGGVLALLFLYFAFWVLDPNETLTNEWSNYIHPMNQAFLFFAGFLIGHLLHAVRLKRLVIHTLLWGGVTAFVLLPTTEDRIDLVTEWNRIWFTLLCVVVCAALFKVNGTLPGPLHLPLVMLGHISYGVYLIHPLIYKALRGLELLSPTGLMVMTVATTLLLAYASYRLFEMPLNRIGRRVSLRL